jgi:mannose-6-phosphate isomerase-like protein (cupin superfamily)
VRIIHLHTGTDGQSHFDEFDLALTAGPFGAGIELFSAVQGAALREVPAGWSLDYHTAPRRQIVFQLSGSGEVTCGDGTSRVVGPGDILLVDDLTGQGHISREVSGPRTQAVIYLDPDFDVGALRSRAGEQR